MNSGDRNFAIVMLDHTMMTDMHRNHFNRLMLYTLMRFSDTMSMYIGIKNEASPKHCFMKKYDMYAPIDPPLLTNSPFWFIISPSLADSIMLWSMFPVVRNETKDVAIQAAVANKMSPKMKFTFSFCRKLNPSTFFNELLLFAFFFFAIFVLL